MGKKSTESKQVSIDALSIIRRFLSDAYKQGYVSVHSVYSTLLDDKGKPIKGLSLNDALRKAGVDISVIRPAAVEVLNSDGSVKYPASEAGELIKAGYISARYVKGGVRVYAMDKLGLSTPVHTQAVTGNQKVNRSEDIFSKVFGKKE